MATSMDLTDLITGQPVSTSSASLHNRKIASASPSSCGTKRIGIDWDLQDCKFEYVNLDKVNFGYSNQDKPPAYRQPVVLSGASFQGSSLKNTTWGYDPLDIINDIFLGDHSYPQKWTSLERKSDPGSVVNLTRTDLRGAKFTVHDSGKTAFALNSSTLDPFNYPRADFARLKGVEILAWNKTAVQSPTFVTVTNASSHDINISNVVTHIFRPWQTVLKPGESFEAWGTTAWFAGNDLWIEAPGVKIIANNPTVAEANVTVNGTEILDDGTVNYAGGGVYVNWLGDQDDAKTWEIKFVN